MDGLTGAPAGDAIIGVDTGGTFTDVTLVDRRTGAVWNAKTPSTPDDPSRGFGQALADILALSGTAAGDVERVLHGTTVATNLILEGKGPLTGMLVTQGFRYVLDIGRQDAPRGREISSWVKPRRPVRPRHILEIPERVGPKGEVLQALDEEAVRSAAVTLRARGIQSIAIVFLHSYANPAHERRAAEIVREAHPEASLSVSSEILPVFREYERTVTTNLNAYVMAAVSGYVGRLEERVREQGIASPLLLMKSSGGVTSARTVRQRPVETALSGPAAGIVGATYVGASAGELNLIGVDIGGTSADISLIYQGEPGLTLQGRVGEWPVSLPMVDLTTIGSGGGSIARVSDARVMTVGPASAGAQPGPVCYRRGGVEPTVTDAHLVLGHLPPYLLDGAFELDVAAARAAIDSKVAGPLGLTVEDAARGILDIVDNHMAGAIRIVSIERGFDPREFVLLPFGGAGPLHGGSLARLMRIPKILIPPSPGVLSALGLLASDLKAEFSRTCVQPAGQANLAVLAQVYAELEHEGVAWLDAERVPSQLRQLRRIVGMKYQGQGFELSLPWSGAVGPEGLAGAFAAFHALHDRLYSFSQPDTPIEITTLRVDATGRCTPPPLPMAPRAGAAAEAEIGRQVMALAEGPVEAPIYQRSALGAGAQIQGPCIVTQLDATTRLLPGQSAVVHERGSLLVTDHVVSGA